MKDAFALAMAWVAVIGAALAVLLGCYLWWTWKRER